MRILVLLGVLAMAAPVHAQSDGGKESSPVSGEARVALELGSALLGTVGTLVFTESFAHAMQDEPIFQNSDGSLRIDPFTASAAYFALFDPFVVSTVVSLTGEALGHRGSPLGSLVGAMIGMVSSLAFTVAVIFAAQSWEPTAPVLEVTAIAFPVLGSVIGFEL